MGEKKKTYISDRTSTYNKVRRVLNNEMINNISFRTERLVR